MADETPRRDTRSERQVDDMLDKSFPASDPMPVSGLHAGGPARDRQPRDDADESRTVLTPEEARQGTIVLNTPLRRWLFVGGLVAAFVVLIGLSVVEFG